MNLTAEIATKKNYKKRNLNKTKKRELPDSFAIKKMGCCTSGESAEEIAAKKIDEDIRKGM